MKSTNYQKVLNDMSQHIGSEQACDLEPLINECKPDGMTFRQALIQGLVENSYNQISCKEFDLLTNEEKLQLNKEITEIANNLYG